MDANWHWRQCYTTHRRSHGGLVASRGRQSRALVGGRGWDGGQEYCRWWRLMDGLPPLLMLLTWSCDKTWVALRCSSKEGVASWPPWMSGPGRQEYAEGWLVNPPTWCHCRCSCQCWCRQWRENKSDSNASPNAQIKMSNWVLSKYTSTGSIYPDISVVLVESQLRSQQSHVPCIEWSSVLTHTSRPLTLYPRWEPKQFIPKYDLSGEEIILLQFNEITLSPAHSVIRLLYGAIHPAPACQTVSEAIVAHLIDRYTQPITELAIVMVHWRHYAYSWAGAIIRLFELLRQWLLSIACTFVHTVTGFVKFFYMWV